MNVCSYVCRVSRFANTRTSDNRLLALNILTTAITMMMMMMTTTTTMKKKNSNKVERHRQQPYTISSSVSRNPEVQCKLTVFHYTELTAHLSSSECLPVCPGGNLPWLISPRTAAFTDWFISYYLLIATFCTPKNKDGQDINNLWEQQEAAWHYDDVMDCVDSLVMLLPSLGECREVFGRFDF